MSLLDLHHWEIFPRASGLRGVLASAAIKRCSLLQVGSLLSTERPLHMPKQPSLWQPELQVGRELTCHPALSFSHLLPLSVSLWGKVSVFCPLRYKEPINACRANSWEGVPGDFTTATLCFPNSHPDPTLPLGIKESQWAMFLGETISKTLSSPRHR